MKLAVAILSAALAGLPMPGLAQADPRSDFHSYCQVENSGEREIWVSQVFPTPVGVDLLDTRMATDFHRHVGTLGGAGNRICVTAVSRAAAEATRARIAAIMGKRSFGIRVYDWHDVAWTPVAGAYAPSAAPVGGPAAAPVLASAPVATGEATRAPASAVGNDDVEEDFWRRIASSQTAEDFDDYLAAYPQGRHAPVARLESRRLRRGSAALPSAGSAAAATATATGPAAVASAGKAAVAPASADYPIVSTVADRVARDLFFNAPAGQGASLSRSGKRIVNRTVPVTMSNTLQRVAGGNLCRLELDSVAGASAPITTAAEGLTWAGFVPLSLRSKLGGSFGTIESNFRLVSVDKTVGQPFPLAEGNRFTLGASFEDINGAGTTTRFSQEWSCRVGASALASTTIPGMAGKQTEVACDMEFIGVKLPAQQPLMVWYDAAGCFVQDPTR